MLDIHLTSIALGLFVGLILAITGAGGAILSIPLLVFFYHLKINEAAPIGLFSLMISAGMSTALGLRAGIVRYKAASLMALCGIVMAPIGVWLAHYLPNKIANIIFAFILLYIAWSTWKNASNSNHSSSQTEASPCQINPATSRLFWTADCTARLSFTGCLAGFLSGLLGVGGGFVIVPTLRKVSNLSIQTVTATSLAVIALVSTSSFVSYALHSTTNWIIAIPFAISTLAGALIGRLFAKKLNPKHNHQIFAILAVIVAIGLLFK